MFRNDKKHPSSLLDLAFINMSAFLKKTCSPFVLCSIKFSSLNVILTVVVEHKLIVDKRQLVTASQRKYVLGQYWLFDNEFYEALVWFPVLSVSKSGRFRHELEKYQEILEKQHKGVHGNCIEKLNTSYITNWYLKEKDI